MPDNPVASDLLTHAATVTKATDALKAAMRSVSAELAANPSPPPPPGAPS